MSGLYAYDMNFMDLFFFWSTILWPYSVVYCNFVRWISDCVFCATYAKTSNENCGNGNHLVTEPLDPTFSYIILMMLHAVSSKVKSKTETKKLQKHLQNNFTFD